ncbi:MAG TPA: glutamyl-tRNA reductase [Fimbriiglobus sp.]|jgi:glutamyl-tRNA reductase|nr:glutamyl-tRNA reductase [Fimbriiglobus sp.]
MNLRSVGCNFRTATVGLREKLAFDAARLERAVSELAARFGCEAVVLGTCNRVELYVARGVGERPFDAGLAAEFLGEAHGLPAEVILPHLDEHADADAVRHLCRVAASLDSLIVGEGQIAGQVRQAFELARKLGTTGPLLNTLVPHALRTAKRVRTETGISQGHVSVSSVAVDYVRQVFDHFGDKTVLVIGAGKMGRLTLKHLRELRPGRILVTNRSPQKAVEVAADCGGKPVPWEQLDDALVQADIVLSTTGAPEPVVPRKRFEERVLPRRSGTLVVLDIAVPRDFDPAVHDGDRVCVFNIDDLTRVREQTLSERRRHVAPAEAIVEAEVRRFAEDWSRRKSGPVIGQLHAEASKLRTEVLTPLLAKLNGKLSPEEKKAVEYAFQLYQNKLLHGPIAALQEASRQGEGPTLMEAIKRFWGLG